MDNEWKYFKYVDIYYNVRLYRFKGIYKNRYNTLEYYSIKEKSWCKCVFETEHEIDLGDTYITKLDVFKYITKGDIK